MFISYILKHRKADDEMFQLLDTLTAFENVLLFKTATCVKIRGGNNDVLYKPFVLLRAVLN